MKRLLSLFLAAFLLAACGGKTQPSAFSGDWQCDPRETWQYLLPDRKFEEDEVYASLQQVNEIVQFDMEKKRVQLISPETRSMVAAAPFSITGARDTETGKRYTIQSGGVPIILPDTTSLNLTLRSDGKLLISDPVKPEHALIMRRH